MLASPFGQRTRMPAEPARVALSPPDCLPRPGASRAARSSPGSLPDRCPRLNSPIWSGPNLRPCFPPACWSRGEMLHASAARARWSGRQRRGVVSGQFNSNRERGQGVGGAVGSRQKRAHTDGGQMGLVAGRHGTAAPAFSAGDRGAPHPPRRAKRIAAPGRRSQCAALLGQGPGRAPSGVGAWWCVPGFTRRRSWG